MFRFWGAQRVQIAAIQILPVTPVNEHIYVAPWVNNVISYTAGELADGTYDDAWKSVIYLALSNVNPQDGAQRSTQLMGWGSGNTYSNQASLIHLRVHDFLIGPTAILPLDTTKPVWCGDLPFHRNRPRRHLLHSRRRYWSLCRLISQRS